MLKNLGFLVRVWQKKLLLYRRCMQHPYPLLYSLKNTFSANPNYPLLGDTLNLWELIINCQLSIGKNSVFV